jgi:2-oxoglutarate ferredoxin oxidoreductase subunit gamma
VTAIRLAGAGGQGIQLAAVILGEAATRAGFHVACSQNYGPQSRGGASRADVILSLEEIDYPRPRKLDVLVALSAKSALASASDLDPSGLMIVDSSIQEDVKTPGELLRLPIVKAATAIGSLLSAGVVALGVVSATTGLLGEEAVAEALASRLGKRGTRNREALKAGLRLGASTG